MRLTDVDLVVVIGISTSIAQTILFEVGRDMSLSSRHPVGGAIALGHPLGCSGARLATTLVHHMRRTGSRYGLQTMCEGGGTANATIYELIG